MKNTNKLTTIILLIFLFFNFTPTYGDSKGGPIIRIVNSKEIEGNITKAEILNFYAKYYEKNVPDSYKYINVNYNDVEKGSKLEDSLKKLIYLDLIENPNINIGKSSELSAWGFFRLSEKILSINIVDKETKKQLQSRKATYKDLYTISDFVNDKTISIDSNSSNKEVKQKIAILNDVFKTISNKHYDKDELDEGKIIDSAIQGLAKGTDDKHTVYFPPIESKTFTDNLDGDYEGIGAYVDMEKPGAVRIVSPIPGSPAEKAGLKGGDLVIKVDGKEIKDDNPLKEVITWIKGPKGSSVVLTIDRDGKVFDIEVTRDRIIITDIEGKKLNTTTYYLQIKSFGEHVSSDFSKQIEEIKADKNISKIIIDLRNNGGGYLSEVAEMLSYFVPKGESTAIVKYHDKDKTYTSRGYEKIDFSKYKIVILQNSGTASASEILIGTLKDYYSDIELIGEKTYGKGSVQVMKNYQDGSLLKYTIAKWFTGKTQTGIDGIGIEPTIELELDIEKYQEDGFDNQLDKAIFIN